MAGCCVLHGLQSYVKTNDAQMIRSGAFSPLSPPLFFFFLWWKKGPFSSSSTKPKSSP